MKNRAGGFTLLQLMIVMASVSMLVAVLSAPVSIFDNHRAAALSIARTQQLVDAAYQFALINDEWPMGEDSSGDTVCDSANATVNTSENIGFFDVFLSSEDSVINAWGSDFVFTCDVDSASYSIEQTVPDEWVEYMANSFDKAVVGNSGGGEATLTTVVDRYGNRSFFQFQMSIGGGGGGGGGGSEEGGYYKLKIECRFLFCWPVLVYVENEDEDEDEDGHGHGHGHENENENEGGFYSIDVRKPACVNGLVPGYRVTSSLMCGSKAPKITDGNGSWENEVTRFSVEASEEGSDFWRFRLKSYLRECEVKVNEVGKSYGCKKVNKSPVDLKVCGGNPAILQVQLYCSDEILLLE